MSMFEVMEGKEQESFKMNIIGEDEVWFSETETEGLCRGGLC